MSTVTVFAFDVGVTTHDLLHEGVTVRHWTRVEVVAGDYGTARLVACQVAACGDWIPTCAEYVE